MVERGVASGAALDVSRIARLFVVAAHPDDDVIGCGGLMAAIAARGGAVRVAYLTDGSRSHPNSRKFPGSALAALRETEASTALAELGVSGGPVFFRLPDGGLAGIDGETRRAATDRLAARIRAFAPDLLVAPWRRDPHADHVAAAEIARDAATSACLAPCAAYEVWLPIHGSASDAPAPGEVAVRTFALDAAGLRAKRRALYAHRSQTSDLIDDDPTAFRITAELAERWLGARERFFFPIAG